MKPIKILLIFSTLFLVAASAAIASDFGWTRDFNLQAQADPSGFRARLATRFKLGDVQINTVLSNFDSPADAYMMLRFGEMSGRPTGYVIEQYRHNKGKGWGALAKSFGIKPGSKEFHALKRGHDLHGAYNRSHYSGNYDRDRVKYVDSGHGKGKGKGKKKWK